MIVVETSALMAIVLDEPEADDISEWLARTEELAISAATLADAHIVARRRGVGEAMAALMAGLGATIAPVTPAEAYDRWGKGVHPAS
jgi:ribonuclease VapC